MGEITDLPGGSNAVFESFKSHVDGHRTSTELTMIEAIRSSHPEYHVTCTSPAQCDLAGFADAGHASIVLNVDAEIDFTRTYRKPVGPRMSTKPATLKDNIRFGISDYIWNCKKFLVYELEYETLFRGPVKFYCILSPVMAGRTATQNHPNTDTLLLAVGAWSTELHEEIYVFDSAHWSKDKELWSSVQGASWDEVILNYAMKKNLIEDVQGFFDNRSLYKSLSVPWKRGIIMHGVPGNGKTISIKALINALGEREDPIPSLYVKSFDNCQGEKISIRTIFSHARSMAPCLLIFEDLDSLVQDKTRSYFLNEVDGLESNDGILMIGSTNHLDKLDPAISKRPSRFDRKYHFKIPNLDERVLYCEFWKRKLEKASGNLVVWAEGLSEIIAQLSEGFSFAYMKELFVIALLTIARGVVAEEDVPNEEPRSSTDSESVMVEHEATKEVEKKVEEKLASVNAEVEEKDQAQQNEDRVTPRTLPEVETPENLRGNLLLRVIRTQLKMLLEEMDNTQEKDWPSGKKEAGTGAPLRRVVRARGVRAN